MVSVCVSLCNQLSFFGFLVKRFSTDVFAVLSFCGGGVDSSLFAAKAGFARKNKMSAKINRHLYPSVDIGFKRVLRCCFGL